MALLKNVITLLHLTETSSDSTGTFRRG